MNNKPYKNNTAFEWIIMGLAMAVLVLSIYYVEYRSINYLLSALLYVLTGVGMISKTVRTRGMISVNVYRIWLVSIALVFVAAALTIITQSRNWHLLWLVALLGFAMTGRKKTI